VLSTYNGERYLEEQVESILNQTLQPLEVIIADDGSSDGTLLIAQDLANRVPGIIHVSRNPERLGFSSNFLQACERARGSHIAFSDQDDRWLPHKLEAQLQALSDRGAVLCAHQVSHIDACGQPRDAPGRRFNSSYVVTPRSASPWGNFLGFTMLFDRKLLDRLPSRERGLDPHSLGAELSHDRWVYFLASITGDMVILADELAEYRQHNGQLYGGLNERSLAERIATKARSGRDQALYLSGVATHRAELITRLSDADSEVMTEQLQRWRSVSDHYARSAAIYERASMIGRLAEFGKNLGQGTYRSPRRHGLGLRKLVEDGGVALLVRSD